MTTLSLRPARHRHLLTAILSSFTLTSLSRWLVEPSLTGLSPFQHDLALTLVVVPVSTWLFRR